MISSLVIVSIIDGNDAVITEIHRDQSSAQLGFWCDVWNNYKKCIDSDGEVTDWDRYGTIMGAVYDWLPESNKGIDRIKDIEIYDAVRQN